jgi:hypothetical protein
MGSFCSLPPGRKLAPLSHRQEKKSQTTPSSPRLLQIPSADTCTKSDKDNLELFLENPAFALVPIIPVREFIFLGLHAGQEHRFVSKTAWKKRVKSRFFVHYKVHYCKTLDTGMLGRHTL